MLASDALREKGPYQSEYGKTRTRKTPNTDTFHAVMVSTTNWSFLKSCFFRRYITKNKRSEILREIYSQRCIQNFVTLSNV